MSEYLFNEQIATRNKIFLEPEGKNALLTPPYPTVRDMMTETLQEGKEVHNGLKALTKDVSDHNLARLRDVYAEDGPECLTNQVVQDWVEFQLNSVITEMRYYADSARFHFSLPVEVRREDYTAVLAFSRFGGTYDTPWTGKKFEFYPPEVSAWQERNTGHQSSDCGTWTYHLLCRIAGYRICCLSGITAAS